MFHRQENWAQMEKDSWQRHSKWCINNSVQITSWKIHSLRYSLVHPEASRFPLIQWLIPSSKPNKTKSLEIGISFQQTFFSIWMASKTWKSRCIFILCWKTTKLFTLTGATYQSFKVCGTKLSSFRSFKFAPLDVQTRLRWLYNSSCCWLYVFQEL